MASTGLRPDKPRRIKPISISYNFRVTRSTADLGLFINVTTLGIGAKRNAT